MDFSEIASVAGKSGLYKVLNPTKTGLILESLSDHSKLVVGPSSKVSILADISIYTTTAEGTAPLGELLRKIHQEFKGDIGLTGSADADELKAFMKEVLPEYDADRVYVSDIKKLVNWYNCFVSYLPEILVEDKPVEDAREATPDEESSKS